MVWQGSLADLGAQQRVRVHVLTRANADAARVLAGLQLAEVAVTDDGATGVLGAVQPEAVVAALVSAGIGVSGFQVEQPNLEDIFVGLTGEGFDVSG
jgi:ABC-2 type transport system ATP-binding protein